MPEIQTQYFGAIAYDPAEVLRFPLGMPGFEQQREFLAIQQQATQPLIFLHSLADAGPCFVALPVELVESNYRPDAGGPERAALGLPDSGELRIGRDLLCLAIVSMHEIGWTANLLGPILINVPARVGVQAIQTESGYSHRHALSC